MMFMNIIHLARIARISTYFLICTAYLYYLSLSAPLGIDWFDWHAQKIFNAAEYLRLNGYFSSYGFSIWSSCTDCSIVYWNQGVYLSANFFPLSPYLLINHFGGKEALFFYGPLIDKTIIFLTGAMIAEIGIKIFKSSFPNFLVGIGIFILFISSPWVYKMFLASWAEIFFIFFLIIALSYLNANKNNIALFFLFLSGLFHYIWGAIIGFFYIGIIFLPTIIKDKTNLNIFLPSISNSSNNKKFLIPLSLLMPFMIQSFLKFFASSELLISGGSSFMTRVGINGDDIHNGGIIGAMQFLAGNRLSTCLPNSGLSIIQENLNSNIFIFNCSLSLIGMAAISLLSIIGLCLLMASNLSAKKFLTPIVFAFFVLVMILQQAFSAHLMGFSYPFAIFFAFGIAFLINLSSKYFSSVILNIIFVTPAIAGIVILSTRVSFLTGING